MILYSQTNQKLLIELLIIIKFQGVPVTLVTHGTRGEGQMLNEAVYTDTLQTKSRL